MAFLPSKTASVAYFHSVMLAGTDILAPKKVNFMLHSRMERVQKMIQQELGLIIDHELRNPEIPQFITVARVKVSNDLGEANVAVTFLTDQSKETIDRTLSELNKSAGYIRTLLARRVRLKRHPHLRFFYTDATKHALGMETLFHKIQQERREPQPAEEDELDGGAGADQDEERES